MLKNAETLKQKTRKATYHLTLQPNSYQLPLATYHMFQYIGVSLDCTQQPGVPQAWTRTYQICFYEEEAILSTATHQAK